MADELLMRILDLDKIQDADIDATTVFAVELPNQTFQMTLEQLINFLPLATIDDRGVVTLASDSEAMDGSDAKKALTSRTGMKALESRISNSVDGNRTNYTASEQAVGKKVSKSGDTMTGDLGITSLRSSKTSLGVFVPDAESGSGMYVGTVEQWLRLFAKSGIVQVFDGENIFKVFHEGNAPTISQVTGLSEALADKPYWRQGTIDLSDKPTDKFYVVHFSQGKNNMSYRSDFFIRGGSGSGGDQYVDSILSGFFQSSGWSSIRPYFNLDWTPYSETKTCIHSVWHGNQSFIGMVVYLRGGFSYHVGTSSTYKLHENDVTLGGSLFPSGVLDPKQGGTNRDIDLYFQELGIGNYVKGDFYAAGKNMYANYFLSLAEKQNEDPRSLTRKDYVDKLVTDSINPHVGKTAVGISVQANDVAGESYQEFYDYGGDLFDLVSFDPSKYETHIYESGYYLVDVVVMRGEVVSTAVSGINVALKVNEVQYSDGFVAKEDATKRNPISLKVVLKLNAGDKVRVYSDQDAEWQAGGSITFQYLRPLDTIKLSRDK